MSIVAEADQSAARTSVPAVNAQRELLPLIHPGEILRLDFLEPMGITAYRLAKDIGVTPVRISEILRGRRAVSAETSLLLGVYFGLSEDYWLRLQADYEVRKARRALNSRLAQVRPRAIGSIQHSE